MKLCMLSVIVLLVFSCSKNEKEDKPIELVALPQNLFVGAIEGASNVSQVRQLKAGQEVIVKGKIMGAKEVFVDNRAIFIIGDPDKLASCNLNAEDSCSTPWDVCCEDPKNVSQATLSVQVVDEKGQVVRVGLKGQNGLKELSEVIVKGKISLDSTAEFMSIEAQSIAVKNK